jgi:putative membrane protein
MRKTLLMLAATAALGACATNRDDMGTVDTVGGAGAQMSSAAADPASPLFHPMYMTMSASSDQFEIRSSQLALQASQNQAVRNYANLMIAHHQATTANLVSAAQSAGLTPPPPALVPQHQALLDQLTAAGAGPAFDAAYKQAQIASHSEALQLQTGYAQGGDIPALRQVAAATAPIVQQHLQQAQILNVDAPMMGGQQPAGGNSPRAGERG